MAAVLPPQPELQLSPALKLKDHFLNQSPNHSETSSQNTVDSDQAPKDQDTPIIQAKNFIFSDASTSMKTSEEVQAEQPKPLPFNKWKLFLVCLGIFLLFIGRFSIPNNDVDGLVDNVFIWCQPINDWIHANKDTWGPKLLLFCCATNMDLIFFATVYMWFKYGKSGRLLYAITIFYTFRTLVQQLSYQPFPRGYYWDSPGFPSFVAPYGRSTDFFFSGHSGFLVLMMNEWKRCGYKWMYRYILGALIYTVFVLMVCQAHYSIDIFTGLVFSDYVFRRVDENKETLDAYCGKLGKSIEKAWAKIFGTKKEKKE